jgi:flagellar hook assembly protein FlgD
LTYPKNEVVLTKINGKELVSFADTLKAQSKVTFSGEIRDGNGIKMTDFNGVVDIVIFDKGILVNTVDIPSTSFSVVSKKIFDGSATVKGGDFNFTFIVSKDINYRVDVGKISLYANVENGTLIDAGGAFNKIYIGSGEKNVPIDNTPPVVKSFINDETFVQGGITNQNPLLLVKLYDESGISSVGGIGNSITATLSHENSQQQFILDSYFKSDRDSYQSGTIKYRLSNLKEGNYTVKVDASDANKNSVGRDGGVLEFNVINGGKLTLNKILNYPNPFTTNTTFHFDHNRAGDDLEVSLQIFTVTGKLVKTLSKFESSSNTHIGDMHWDGKDEYGDNIGRGVYVYKLSVKALSDGAKKEEYQKLVILN